MAKERKNYVVSITRTFEVAVVAADKTEAKEVARDTVDSGAGVQVDEEIIACGPDDI